MTTTLGQMIKASRNAAGLTQPEAAATANVSVGTWSRTERDRLVPEPRYLAAMAHATGVTPAMLEECGQGKAASLLRARINQGENDQRQRWPNPIIAAMTSLWQTAVDQGWSFSMKHPDSDLYVIELRRETAVTAVAETDRG